MSRETPASTTEPAHGTEWWREAFTMGFYVAIVLVAALVAIDDEQHRLPTLAIIWGTTIGLALAHLFAFRLASRLVGSGEVGPDDGALALAQLAGAATVAILASIPVLLFDTSVELDATRLVLVGSIGVAAYAIGRGSGAGRMRALLFAGGVLVLGVAVALFKNYLAGH